MVEAAMTSHTDSVQLYNDNSKATASQPFRRESDLMKEHPRPAP